MSNTRRKTDPTRPISQERFASSPEYQRGLMANLVAKRCSALAGPQDRALIWWLQWRSHQPGGLEQLCLELKEKYPHRIATKTMQRIGIKPGQIYNAEQVRAIRDGMDCSDTFLLRGELTDGEKSRQANLRLLAAHGVRRERELEECEIANSAKMANRPSSYPAESFLKVCRSASRELADRITEYCLDPAAALAGGPWYFPTLVETLREHLAETGAQAARGVVVTDIGRRVHETLDYAREIRGLVLIDGNARIGKSFAGSDYCKRHPEFARYVQVPATNDDFSFFRAIAASLGVSVSLNSKAHHLRERIEDVLQGSDIFLIFDEAHYVWGQYWRGYSAPTRVNWIMTALVNYGVPVALITTPQFFITQKELEKRSGWTSEQFTGRLKHCERLPDSLSKADLQAVAKALLPEGCSNSIKALVAYATASVKYLASIDAMVSRARYLARRAGRSEVGYADIMDAIDQSVVPSDNALAAALTHTPARPLPRQRRGIAAPLPEAQAPDQPNIQGRRNFAQPIESLPSPEGFYSRAKPVELAAV